MKIETVPLSGLGRAMRMALMATSATLAIGLTLWVVAVGPAAGAAPVARQLIWLGLAMLVAIPVLNVVDVMITEWRHEEWPFVGAAVAVLALLAYSIVSKLWH